MLQNRVVKVCGHRFVASAGWLLKIWKDDLSRGPVMLMFGLPLFSTSTHARSGPAQLFSEFVATFGLMAVIWGCARHRPSTAPYAVGTYISAAYWFTASTSFANPAVTLARSVTNTFSGIRYTDLAGFVGAQLAGAFAATLLFRWLIPSLKEQASAVMVEQRTRVGLRRWMRFTR